MSIDPTLNERDDQSRPAPGEGENVADLKGEIERLRAQLAQARSDAATFRQAAYAMLNERVPYTPPSEEELRDMLHGPRGLPMSEVIDQLEREGEG